MANLEFPGKFSVTYLVLILNYDESVGTIL